MINSRLLFGIYSADKNREGYRRDSTHAMADSKALNYSMVNSGNHLQEFTEVFSWGSDRHGQLGLGKNLQSQKQFYSIPRFCSYNIAISQVACGSSHSVFITSNPLYSLNIVLALQLVYSMGSNAQGQLGIDDPYT